MVLLLKVLQHRHVLLLLPVEEDEIAWAPVGQPLGTVAPAHCTILPADLDLRDQTWPVELEDMYQPQERSRFLLRSGPPWTDCI